MTEPFDDDLPDPAADNDMDEFAPLHEEEPIGPADSNDAPPSSDEDWDESTGCDEALVGGNWQADSEAGEIVDLPNFDPATDSWDGAGDPVSDMEYWHEQEQPDTCGVASQEFILESLTGEDFTEDELRDEAESMGWYTPGGGTPMEYMGALLEAHGLDVQRQQGATLDDLTSALAQGDKVMVAVDSAEIWTPGTNPDNVDEYPGIPGQDADHAVEVIGIDTTGPHGAMAVLNDPGHPDGQGLMVPLDEFQAAWEDSGNFAVMAAPADSQQSETAPPPQKLAFGGYYNADGTYHWSSDNTDRDPETDAIVRRW